MMLQLRALDSLGGGNRDWFKARHRFAVDSQGNPGHARLGNLVVWNDDEIAPHSGFPMHGQVGERDGIAIVGEPGITITAIEPAEIILVDTA